jgi:hypothetical protein
VFTFSADVGVYLNNRYEVHGTKRAYASKNRGVKLPSDLHPRCYADLGDDGTACDGFVIKVTVVYLTPKIERIISLLSTSPEGEVQCQCQNGMAYKD